MLDNFADAGLVVFAIAVVGIYGLILAELWRNRNRKG